MADAGNSPDRTARITAWAGLGVSFIGLVVSAVALAYAFGFFTRYRVINPIRTEALIPAFLPTDDCFTEPDGSLHFNNRPKETGWVQCKTQNGVANASTYVFRLADLGVSDDYRIVGMVGTFGVEVYSFQEGALLHWVVRLDGRPICTVPQNGSRLTISTVSIGPGDCELVDEARPSIGDADELTILQVVDARRTNPLEDFIFGGIVQPALELQKK